MAPKKKPKSRQLSAALLGLRYALGSDLPLLVEAARSTIREFEARHAGDARAICAELGATRPGTWVELLALVPGALERHKRLPGAKPGRRAPPEA